MPLSAPAVPAVERQARAPVRALALAAVLLGLAAVAAGLWGGAQGPVVSMDWMIVYIHVPAAWLSLAVFAAAVGAAAALLQLPQRLPLHTLGALAPVGAAAAFVALWTGLTSQQARGAWWGWDARLVCELVLLLLFLAVVALRRVVDEPARAERAAAVLVLVGALDVPIIYLSVDWWHTLHERVAGTVGRSPLAVTAMVVMTLAFCLYALALVLARLETLERDRGAARDFETARIEGGGARTPAKEQQ